MAFDFYSRASCEARHISLAQSCALGTFYSRASCEARQPWRSKRRHLPTFLLTRLMRGATERRSWRYSLYWFLLTRLMRGATFVPYRLVWEHWISTHAPHARRDGRHLPYWSMAAISTHAPHARRDTSTGRIAEIIKNFYSRASCEARLNEFRENGWLLLISTHAPHARRDNKFAAELVISDDFYSRASCEARPQHLVWHNTNTAVVPQEADKIKRRLSVKNCFSLLLSCFFRRSFPKNQSHLTFAWA